jgi:hypothetical protein
VVRNPCGGEILPIRQAATLLNVHPNTVRNGDLISADGTFRRYDAMHCVVALWSGTDRLLEHLLSRIFIQRHYM